MSGWETGPEPQADSVQPLGRARRRPLLRLRVAGESFFAKRLAPRSRAARWLRLDAASREWRALSALHRAGVPVPEPIALGTRPDGERVLVTRFVAGVALKAFAPRDRAERVATARAVGELVRALHGAGWVHRDLHWGNVLIGSAGPHLVDLQAAWPLRARALRTRDLGDLDYSLRRRWSVADRLRMRAAALGAPAGERFDSVARGRLRAIGRAADAQARAHAASRTRRALRPGRQYAPLRAGAASGLRVRDVPADAIDAALRSDAPRAVWKDDARARVSAVSNAGGDWVVKEFRARTAGRALADGVRGSAARRAWRGGHGLVARGIGAARPVAFCEVRRFGLPVASTLVLERLVDRTAADRCAPERASDEEVMRALRRLAVALHRRGAEHGDLKASHVLLAREGSELVGSLIDLEGVRFPRRLGDRARVRALAQLNASLPDRIPNALRLAEFDRYARAVPFDGDPRRCLRRIVDQSLARAHRWSGGDCALAARGADQREMSTQRK